MTRTHSILTAALLALSAALPLVAARALGSLETPAAVAGACLDAKAVEITPAVEPQVEADSCSAEEDSEVLP